MNEPNASEVGQAPAKPKLDRTRDATRFRVAFLIQAAVASALFFLVASTIEGDIASDLEESIFRALNDLPGVFLPPLWLAMQAGNLVALPVAAVGAAVARWWFLAAGLLALVPAKLFVAQLIKDEVVRHRPGAFLEDVDLRGVTDTGRAFVSGHATVAVAIAVAFHPYVSRNWRIAIWTVAVLTCLGRIYVGAHLPLDVVGGAAVGCTLASLLHFLIGPPKSR
jgi:glycosyltransferase 2 family protein